MVGGERRQKCSTTAVHTSVFLRKDLLRVSSRLRQVSS